MRALILVGTLVFVACDGDRAFAPLDLMVRPPEGR
jgi:hypothetical protein